MNTVKHLHKYLFLGLLLFLPSNNIKADYPHVHHSEKEFAMNAQRHELIDAYQRKCAENHYLAQDLEKVKKNNWSFKSLARLFFAGVTVGIIVGSAGTALAYYLVTPP